MAGGFGFFHHIIEKGENIMDNKDIVWYYCKCGQAFSNEKEIDEPDIHPNWLGHVIRYYFEHGTVVYPPGGGTHKATCYRCAEGG